MDKRDKEHLRIVISVALATAKKRIMRAFVDRYDETHDAACRELSQMAADAVLQCFEVKRKTDSFGPSAHAHFTAPSEERQ